MYNTRQSTDVKATGIHPAAGREASPCSAANCRARRILNEISEPSEASEGEFWRWAFHCEVLRALCRLREGLQANCRSDARKPRYVVRCWK
jgi:hypothetical protein